MRLGVIEPSEKEKKEGVRRAFFYFLSRLHYLNAINTPEVR